MGKGALIHSQWQCKLVQPLWKTVWRSLKKLKLELLYDPEMPLLSGIDLKACKSGYNRDIYTPMFIAALFTITTLSNRPRCPSTDEFIKKIWHI
jgi:hypothetical protein